MFKIYAVSDSIGETAELVAKGTASQFKVKMHVKRVPYIKTLEDVYEFMNTIDVPDKCMVISNIILPEIRDFLVQRCMEKGIFVYNVLSPCMNIAAKITGEQPIYEPGAVWNIDNEYYEKIEAMQFAVQYDDSKDVSGIKNADVVIVGLSRSSKTALCMYLANKGIKALNVPLMPEVPVPDELLQVDRKKIIGLTINPLHLIEIRKHRLLKFGGDHFNINYANEERILEEFDFLDKVFKRLGCRVIDVTQRAIEDTALIIMESIGWVEKSI
ncbi:pyruvate, water dikinase regulatory protein [Haloimpatiens massiliensis]|uniref:pyruvate, water dikinase regulatory protein n=1 Tax=Haloimpatiens massiliensis TaxID=1658110 RepID=UPI000C84E44C|nr:pyruvate, water dikinase regulatory protein [Haloimpatiens massiliensis]